MHSVGYLGPRGTFSEDAAGAYLGNRDGILIECATIEDVLSGIAAGNFDEGVVPVENSTEGAVNVVLDLLAGSFDLVVRKEIILPVRQALMSRRENTLEQIERVLSHPQALAQCRVLIRRLLPGAVLEECHSTAAAADRVAASSRPWAVLGHARACEYGLRILIPVANDCPDNVTRFWILGREKAPCTAGAGCKTSLIFEVGDRPGALYEILREFALRGINLTRIESRPARKRLGDYLFFLDFTGSLEQPEVQEALEQVTALTKKMKILGSYRIAEQTALYQIGC